MILLEESLYSFLTNSVDVSAIIGDRMYGMVRPEKDPTPSIVYSRATTLRTQTLCKTDSKVRATMTVDSIAKTYLGVKRLARAVGKALSDFTGDMYGTRVSTVILESEIDLDDPDPGLYRVSQTYLIWFVEE